MNSNFDTAFNITMTNEGEGTLTNDNLDQGGQTYSGISRVYWPEWAGWSIIDNVDLPFTRDTKRILYDLVKSFYRVNFWNRIQGEKISEISQKLACELFDTAVNVGVSMAVKFLQEAHNVTSTGYQLNVDGQLGQKTIEAVARFLPYDPGPRSVNEEILINCCNGEQYIFYKSNPNHKRFRGWFRRV